MKISVNEENGRVFQHFGKTKLFRIYDVEDGKILNVTQLAADENGHGALAKQLQAEHVQVAICGGLGMGMLNALKQAGIQVCANVTGSVEEAVQAYLNGTLVYSEEAHACSGHHHE